MTRRRHWAGRRTALVAIAMAVVFVAAGCRARDDGPQALPTLTLYRPLTGPVLGLMPEGTALAVATPCPEETGRSVLGLWRQVAADPAMVDDWADGIAEESARLFGVKTPASLPDVCRARGIDPHAPAALFIRFADQGAASKEIRAAIGSLEKGEDNAEIRDNLTGLAKAASAVEWVVVTECLDPDLTSTTLTEMLSGAAAAGIEMEPRETEGITIRYWAPRLPCFFTVGTRLVVGNALGMVEGVAARLNDPVALAYGSTACPCNDTAESVILIPADNLDSLKDTLLRGRSNVWAPLVNPLIDGYVGTSPAVVTVNTGASSVDVAVRADHATHAGLRPVRGEPVRLRHPGLLPPTTLGSITVEMNQPVRERVTATWLAAMPNEMVDSPEYGQVAGMARRIVNQFNGEFTVAAVSREAAAPAILVLAQINDEAETREFLLTLGFPGAPSDVEGAVDIMRVSLSDWGMPDVYYAVDGGAFMAATDLAELRALIRLTQTGGGGGFDASLDPPIDDRHPHYRLCVLRQGLFEAVAPLLGMVGGTENEAPVFVRVAQAVREFRWSAVDRYGWYESRLSVELR